MGLIYDHGSEVVILTDIFIYCSAGRHIFREASCEEGDYYNNHQNHNDKDCEGGEERKEGLLLTRTKA